MRPKTIEDFAALCLKYKIEFQYTKAMLQTTDVRLSRLIVTYEGPENILRIRAEDYKYQPGRERQLGNYSFEEIRREFKMITK